MLVSGPVVPSVILNGIEDQIVVWMVGPVDILIFLKYYYIWNITFILEEDEEDKLT